MYPACITTRATREKAAAPAYTGREANRVQPAPPVPMNNSTERRVVDHSSADVQQLQATIRSLEEEVAVLRRRLQDAPRRVRVLEERLLETKNKLSQAAGQNQKLSTALEETREQLALLREEVEKLTAPPNPFGTILGINEDGTADVFTSGRKLRVNVEPNLEIKALEVGQEVLLNESYNVIDVRTFTTSGEVVTIKEVLDEDRLIVLGRADEERVVEISAALRGHVRPRGRPRAARTANRSRVRKARPARGRGARPRRGPGRHLRTDRRPR